MLEYTVREDLDFGKKILTEKDIKAYYKIEDSTKIKKLIKQLIELGYIYDKNNAKSGNTEQDS